MGERNKAIYSGNTLASGVFSALVVMLLLSIKEIDQTLAVTAFFIVYAIHFIFVALFAHWYLSIPRYRHFVKRMNIRGYFMLPFGLILSIPFFAAIILYVNEWKADQPIVRYGVIAALLGIMIPVLTILDRFGLSEKQDRSRRQRQRHSRASS
ncbi:MAG: hypothetical protein AAF065_08650 [Verrucomicrobiota bacterium]